ncbi:hypothetical protein GCM10028818_59100 [Spirosoma horti]
MTPLKCLEKLAELLNERMHAAQNNPLIDLAHKVIWSEILEHLKISTNDANSGVEDSSNYYLMLDNMVLIWDAFVQQNHDPSQRFAQLDAFFDLVESKLLDAEKISAGQRIYEMTKYGILVVGGRPLLSNSEPNTERAPLSVRNPYRRIFLLPKIQVDFNSELIQAHMDGYGNGTDPLSSSCAKLTSPELTIGLGAFSGDCHTYFLPTRRLSAPYNQTKVAFLATDVQPAEVYEQELIACIDWAITNKVNILCLPELTISLTGRKIMKEYIKELGQKKQLEYLGLIIAGSYHINNYNETPVWFIDYLGHINEHFYKKYEAFETHVDVYQTPDLGLEAIHNYVSTFTNVNKEYYIREDTISDENILLLNLPIGSIGILICKDMITYNLCLAKYRELEPDYLFIVSMNKKAGEFWDGWKKDMKRSALSAGFYVNATQVIDSVDSETEVIFWGLPGRLIAKNGLNQEMYFRNVDNDNRKVKKLPPNGLVHMTITGNHRNHSAETFY